MPRGVETNLLVVTRLTVAFVHADRLGDVAQDQRLEALNPVTKKRSCWRTISVATLRMVVAR